MTHLRLRETPNLGVHQIGSSSKIRDLEKSWDDAEPTLRPSNQVVWKRIDKSIDNALVELRADTPIAQGCSEALENLLTEMDKVSKKIEHGLFSPCNSYFNVELASITYQ
ncbi:hypothetical protein [Afipia sp. DC4300-2b1]|uniref:hypothetical protein n=1 Tax=Afipia sp. DC4300-2b1 TaxID=2804672 RepID=UPI003CEE7B56